MTYYPFRNLIGDYSAHFDFVTRQTSIKTGIPTSGPAVAPSGADNSMLDLSFNRAGRVPSLKWSTFKIKLFGLSVRMFKSQASAFEWVAGNRVQGSYHLIWRFVIERQRTNR